ncbi:tripartite motif containing 3 [Phyllostomus discolor]|uniref:Tripartite motif containing 3 n=1 Tax=Phyllostomus discolor TaxID=89673 RepID=A0A834E7S6_9CHIR|nr:tripartite motif containing 3 [Phyllostomus discolor]
MSKGYLLEMSSSSGCMSGKPGKNWAIAADMGVLSPGASPPPPPRPCPLPEARSPVPSPLPCQVYSADGEFLFKFGSHGEGNGQFNAPTGVAVDSNGNIIVADWGNSRIQVFDSSGSFLSYINTSAEPLYGPQGLALTSDGHVVVADAGNHCFKAYRYLQ